MKLKGIFSAFTAVALMIQIVLTPPAYAADDPFADTSWFDPYDIREEYELHTQAQLLGLAELVTTRYNGWGYTFNTFEGITIKLGNDIQMTCEWEPVGFSETHPFAGQFDGQGYGIYNISISDDSSDNTGVFGYLTGTVKNLTVTGQITGRNNTGGICGTAAEEASIINCRSEISVTGHTGTGGIAGSSYGTITGCTNTGDIHGTARAGGIAGENRAGEITDCYNEGNISSEITGIGTYGTGGIAGRSVAYGAAIKNCYNAGDIDSSNECAGGIAGYCSAAGSEISGCANSGAVAGSQACGGIAGSVTAGIIITDSYNAGKVTGKYAGGIAGIFTDENNGSFEEYITDNYYADNSAAKAVGMDKDSPGRRNYRKSIMSKSYNYMISAIKTWQNETAEDKTAVLEQIDIKNKNFISFYKKHPDGMRGCERMFIEFLSPQITGSGFTEAMKEITKEN